MGLLSKGKPLSWEDTKKVAEHVRSHGITQFINVFKKLKDRHNDVMKWGDEIEYHLIHLDNENKVAKLALLCSQILPQLQEEELTNPGNNPTAWRMEFASYMIEGTPGQPFGGPMCHFGEVESNMLHRREELYKSLSGFPGCTMINFAAFPRIGTTNNTMPTKVPNPEENEASKSIFIHDDVIFSDHPRYRNLSRNTRSRRGEKPPILVPVFKDVNTPSPFIDPVPNPDNDALRAMKPDHIYMDCMTFGMGCCCLQLTIQACNINEARNLYDQLAVMAPIMMALSAASPSWRGFLSDWDCRWHIISASVDERTEEEMGLKPLSPGSYRIPKSRYDAVSLFIHPSHAHHNDTNPPFNQEYFDRMVGEGVDDTLAKHFAHLFIRDPVSVFEEKLHQDDTMETDHFENIQSTNWQTVRFKPPPMDSSMGWRVEFRPMECQLTDFENAAYVVFMALLTRAILSFNLNLTIPISKVDENMSRAKLRDSVNTQQFYFRKCIQRGCTQSAPAEDVELMSLNAIMNGVEGAFPGLISIIQHFLDSVEVDLVTRCRIQRYLSLIGKRASGELPTMAGWIRKFVMSHPSYKHDSVVSEDIMYDLSVKADRISRHIESGEELLGKLRTGSENKTVSEYLTMPKLPTGGEELLWEAADRL